ncbi:hypothetical protein FACS1894151_09930 [Spirochaetia bacterium]|nr:hypothetical protein FACS1894151_09930 [Spirochaetia bacterium]
MQKGKILILGLLVLAVSSGSLYAQNISGGFNRGSGFGLTLFQAQGQYPGYDPEAIKAQQQAAAAPMYAGLKNMAFGLWSWQNGDIFGGAMTAGLEGVGLALVITGLAIMPQDGTPDAGDPDKTATAFLVFASGAVAMGGGALFGYFWGSSQYKKQNAVATGFDGNPLEHISFGIIPGVGGSLMYSTSF